MNLINKLLADPLGVYLIICIVIIIFLIVALFFLLKLYYEERRVNDEANQKEVARTRETNNLKHEYSVLDYNYRLLLKKVKQLEDEKAPILNEKRPRHVSEGYEEIVNKAKKKRDIVQETTNDDGTIKSEINFDLSNDESTPVPFSPKYEYLEAANGGQFRKLLPSDDKCFFRTWEENGVRKFEFHGNVDKALANINAIFDDVCEIEGKQNGATQIINLDPGVLTDQLKVDTPAKIKLI